MCGYLYIHFLVVQDFATTVDVIIGDAEAPGEPFEPVIYDISRS